MDEDENTSDEKNTSEEKNNSKAQYEVEYESGM